MTKAEAVHIVAVLIARNADCRCGNKWLENDEIEALHVLMEAADPDNENTEQVSSQNR